MNHGLFTYDDDARASYSRMIDLVTRAEGYLSENGADTALAVATEEPKIDLLTLCRIRKAVSDATGKAMIAQLDVQPEAVGFSSLPELESIATRGLLTPDHVLFAKRLPMILMDDPAADVWGYVEEYARYFERNVEDGLSMLDPAPRWVLWPGLWVDWPGGFGQDQQHCQ